MVKPSPALCGRLRFTTKQVGRGFYRGNRTGSMGAHTEYGQYVIDWRKTKHFNVPDTTDFALSPFITQEMERTTRAIEGPNGEFYTPEKVDGLEFLRTWKRLNIVEYDDAIDHQQKEAEKRAQAEANPQIDLVVAEKLEEPVQQNIYTQDTESGRNPFQQQQTRQLHTSSRRLITATKPAPSEPVFSPSTTKEWLDMTREERKTLVNKATTIKLRQLKKEGIDITSQEKKKIKFVIKNRARDELIGKGILRDQEQFEKIMTAEGRNRKRQGLPRRTEAEKNEFIMKILENPASAKNVIERILEEATPPQEKLRS